jgi:hypothetical protein
MVFNSGGFIGTALAAAGILCGLSCNAATTVHAPHPNPPSSPTNATLRTPALISRQRPPLDIARGFTGWEISLQLRAAGTLT